MRRIVLTTLLLFSLLGVPAEARTPSPALPVKAKLTDCHIGPHAGDRYAVFVGQMGALKRTRRMWMRFELLQRTSFSGSFRRVAVPKFGAWEKSRPRTPGFIYTKRVDQLLAPAAYRVVVRFRWYDARNHLQRELRRSSPICHQPDQRPDLRIGAVTATAAGKGLLSYAITVRNHGRSDAGPFGAVLVVDGQPQPTLPVAGLPAGGVTKVLAIAPRCIPGSQIQITLDPEGVIDEVDETNDEASRLCPIS